MLTSSANTTSRPSASSPEAASSIFWAVFTGISTTCTRASGGSMPVISMIRSPYSADMVCFVRESASARCTYTASHSRMISVIFA